MEQTNNTQKDIRTRNFSILGVAVIVIIGLAVVFAQHKKVVAPVSPTDTPHIDVSETPAQSTLSYTDAVVQYKGHMVTLTGSCVLDPQTQTQKPGIRILINNASTTTQTLTIGVDKIVLSPLHYKTLKLPATEGNFFIGCGDVANAATIAITK